MFIYKKPIFLYTTSSYSLFQGQSFFSLGKILLPLSISLLLSHPLFSGFFFYSFPCVPLRPTNLLYIKNLFFGVPELLLFLTRRIVSTLKVEKIQSPHFAQMNILELQIYLGPRPSPTMSNQNDWCFLPISSCSPFIVTSLNLYYTENLKFD